jgi:uncharacterized membrane protein YkoI
MRYAFVSAALALLALAPLSGQADPKPRNSKPIEEIIAQLEKTYDPIVEISFDDGVWEVEAFKGETAYELAVDPRTGEVISELRDYGEDRPPAGSLSLSAILSLLAKDGYTDVVEIDYERGRWEIEAFRNRQKRELHVDPETGRVTFDRVDD